MSTTPFVRQRTPKNTPGYPKSPPPGADPRGEWYQRPSDGEWVWILDHAEPKANPSEAVLAEQGEKVREALRVEAIPRPSDLEGEEEVNEKIKAGWKWYELPNGKRILRKEHANPDLRPQLTDAEIVAAVAAGKVRLPSENEVRANVAAKESTRKSDGRVRITPEAAGRLNIPQIP